MAGNEGYSDSAEIKNLIDRMATTSMGAEFFLADLHLHTPASVHDFKFENQLYEDASVQIVEEKACRLGIIPSDREILKQWKVDKSDDEYKDWLMVGILIEQARKAKLRIMAITDHNSVKWYRAIKAAERSSRKKTKCAPICVLPGVEITARDDIHIIAIVSPDKVDVLDLYLEALEYRRKTNQPVTADVIISEIVDKMNGIAYVPHITQNHMKTKDMKEILVANEKVLAIGVSSDDKITYYEDVANKHNRKTPLAIIHDSDAHSDEEFGRNPIWLKMTQPTFEGVKKALRSPKTRVCRECPPDIKHQYLVGAAFLDSPVGKERKDWNFIRFNPHLNCFIGARGTGKSTIINWLIAGLQERLYSNEPHVREWMGDFGRVVIFLCKHEEYFVIDINPIRSECEPIDNHRPVSIERWITVYRQHGDRFVKVKDRMRRSQILDGFRTVSFSQTDIEDHAQNRASWHALFVRFLKETPYSTEYENAMELRRQALNLLDKTALDLIQQSSSENPIKNLQRGSGILNESTQAFDRIEKCFANDLNIFFRDKFKFEIIIEKNSNEVWDAIMRWVDALPQRFMPQQIAYFEEVIYTILNKENVQSGILNLIQMQPDALVELYKIKEFIPEMDNAGVMGSIIPAKAIDTIKKALFSSREASWSLRKLLKIEPVLSIRVEHNINLDKGRSKNNIRFKLMDHLSIGQKCVAMLNFLMGVAEYLGDHRPLIMDQPEDHLDNRYIYDCLVRDIYEYKAHRQVILSTHNANIPVAADAENIFVMTSNGESFWIDQNGSVDFESRDNSYSIVNDVQDILEGGKAAFLQRLYSYGY